MNRKDAIAHARREAHTAKVRVVSWEKQKIARANGEKGHNEIALLVYEYDSKADWKTGEEQHTWTRLQVFIDGRASFGGYVG